MAKRVDAELARILTALRAEESPLRRSGVALIVDFVLARPLRDFVDPEGLIRLLTDSLQSANVVEVLRDRIPQAWSGRPTEPRSSPPPRRSPSGGSPLLGSAK